MHGGRTETGDDVVSFVGKSARSTAVCWYRKYKCYNKHALFSPLGKADSGCAIPMIFWCLAGGNRAEGNRSMEQYKLGRENNLRMHAQPKQQQA